MKTRFDWLLLLLIAGFLITGCSPKAKYERMLKHELASGIRNDSLFLGLYFGMPEKEFYMHCWNLNQKGLIKQGESNVTVLYEFKKNELKYPCSMDFYPRFNQGKIFEMPVRFFYQAWAPWNKELAADKLETEVLKYCEKLYGKGFITVKHPKRGIAYVKVDGNRRITIFKEDERHIWAVFTDMLVKTGWNENQGNAGVNADDITKDLKK
jgi:hypothetical protein